MFPQFQYFLSIRLFCTVILAKMQAKYYTACAINIMFSIVNMILLIHLSNGRLLR